MNSNNGANNLRRYLQLPLYMLIVFAAGNTFVYFRDMKSGAVMSMVIATYAIIVIFSYRTGRKRINEDIVYFATQYSTVQHELLDEFQVPYGLMDTDGKMLWMNQQMMELTGKDKHYRKSITSIFSGITREELEKNEEESFTIPVTYNDKKFEAKIQRITVEIGQDAEGTEGAEVIGNNDIAGIDDDINKLIAILLFDVTELEALRQENTDQKLVSGLIYVDNSDEVFDSVDEVKKSLLIAIIDRKINKYFQSAKAIVRKLDDDKYFLVFQQKYLKELEEDKFSLLEDIKTTKAGNDIEITLSVGLGYGAETYTQDAEYSRAAIDLAMGRGGSQVVIKNGEDVSYFSSRGKEIERNTRVKARMKAQALREIMETRENIMIMGHNIADVDSFGAAVGIYCAARDMGKTARIVINTITSSLSPLVDDFNVENGYPEDMFLNSEEAIEMADAHTLVIVVDTNRPSYTDCPELLKISKSIVVFDHHRVGNEKVDNPVLSYIEPYASSVCEMIAEVLQYFSEKINIRPHEADCIYAGILIDTNNFMTKTGVRTFEAAAYLRRCGAEVTRVRKLLREDMSAYKARAEIVRHAEVYKGYFAISVFEGSDLESPTVVGAKAANELLNIVGIKASFVLTEFQNKVFVSSRSIDEIDVQLIMERLGGGGHLNVAGAQIENCSIEEAKHRIQDILDDLMEEGEITL
ncbi:MAG: DHH family phosphoesterase [Lachnospiraceae bacterium]|nr:DHH family phosphoesterase [Lachnospiraceae bacterium]